MSKKRERARVRENWREKIFPGMVKSRKFVHQFFTDPANFPCAASASSNRQLGGFAVSEKLTTLITFAVHEIK